MAYQQVSTVRVGLPKEITDNTQNIKILGNDILLYVNKDNLEKVKSNITDLGLTIINRIYKIHVSAPSKEVFETIFKKYLSEIKYDIRNNNNRFIVTITTDNDKDYAKYLELDSDVVLVKPFKTNVYKQQTEYRKW